MTNLLQWLNGWWLCTKVLRLNRSNSKQTAQTMTIFRFKTARPKVSGKDRFLPPSEKSRRRYERVGAGD